MTAVGREYDGRLALPGEDDGGDRTLVVLPRRRGGIVLAGPLARVHRERAVRVDLPLAGAPCAGRPLSARLRPHRHGLRDGHRPSRKRHLVVALHRLARGRDVVPAGLLAGVTGELIRDLVVAHEALDGGGELGVRLALGLGLVVGRHGRAPARDRPAQLHGARRAVLPHVSLGRRRRGDVVARVRGGNVASELVAVAGGHADLLGAVVGEPLGHTGHRDARRLCGDARWLAL